MARERRLLGDPVLFIQDCVRRRRLLWTYHVQNEAAGRVFALFLDREAAAAASQRTSRRFNSLPAPQPDAATSDPKALRPLAFRRPLRIALFPRSARGLLLGRRDRAAERPSHEQPDQDRKPQLTH